MKKIPTYVCQPTELGHLFPYCVARYNLIKEKYFPIKGEEYPTRELAEARAAELNMFEKEDDNKEYYK